MEESSGFYKRLQLLIVALAIVVGGLYANSRFPRRQGFLSPVDLGASQAQDSFSPFAPLLAFKSGSLDSVLPNLGKVLGLTAETPVKIENKPSMTAKSTSAVSTANSSSSDSNNQSANVTSSTTTTTSAGSSSSSNSPNNSSTPAYTSAQQAVEDVTSLIIGYLKNSRYEVLYNLMSGDFKNTFSKDDFVNSFYGSGAVVSGGTAGSPRIYGNNSEWAEQVINLTLTGGVNQRYLNVYHLENGAWTLFGTEEQ